MICPNCGGNYESDTLKCPYCGSVNEKALTHAKTLQKYDKEFAATRDQLLETGHLQVLRHLTIGICLTLTLIVAIFSGLTYYYEHRETWRREAAVKGEQYKENLSLITTYLDSKNYSRALAVAYGTDPTYSSVASYPDVEEELSLISSYSSFMFSIQSYITHNSDVESLYLSPYEFIFAKKVYDAKPSSKRAKTVQADLCQSLDLYLKYYLRFTDEELQDLKEANDIDSFEIEGTTHFTDILKERITAYEKNF